MMHSALRFIPDIFLRNRIAHLTLFITRRCNLGCDFCFYLKGAGDVPMGPELSVSEIDKITRSLGSQLWVSLSGGEIFLREDLIEICKAVYDNSRPTIILLPTNGLMPERIAETTEKILRQSPKSVVVVKISLDGIGNKHDDFRGKPGCFDLAMRTYEMLGPLLDKHKNFELGINTVFAKGNQDCMPEIIDFVKGLDKIKTHTISLCRGEGANEVDMGKYLKAAGMLESSLKDGSAATYEFKGARLKAAQDVIQRRLIHRTMTEDKRQIECLAGRINLVIAESGEAYPCESFKDMHRLGNVREFDGDIRALMDSKRAKGVINDIQRGCYCTHECFMMTNILFNPLMYPGLFWEYISI